MKINVNKIVVVGGLVALTAISALAAFTETYRITVRSKNYHYKIQRVPFDRPVRLVRQISDAPCDFGLGWGRNEKGVWVNHGCQATFEVGPHHFDSRPGWDGRGYRLDYQWH